MWFYADTKAHATSVRTDLERIGMRIEEFERSDVADELPWVVVAGAPSRVGEADLDALDQRMQAVADAHKGVQYDGWETAADD